MRGFLICAALSLLVACGATPEITLQHNIPSGMRVVNTRVQHSTVNVGNPVDVLLSDNTLVIANVKLAGLVNIDPHHDIASFLVAPPDAYKLTATGALELRLRNALSN